MRRSMTCWLGTAGLLLAVPFLLTGCYRPPAGTAQLAGMRQEEAARLIGRPKEFINSVGMKMVLIPAGEFQMGSSLSAEELVAKYPDTADWCVTGVDIQQPVHRVTVMQPFYLGVTEVTQAEWVAVMGENPSTFKGEERPVESAPWERVIEFCRKLSVREGVTYSLPTEAEWEYACRAGTKTLYHFGDNVAQLGDYAWYRDNSCWTHPPKKLDDNVAVFGAHGRYTDTSCQTYPVAQKKPNAWGLYDMHGNVGESCEDVWHGNYDGAPTDGSSWLTGGTQEWRMIRGGSYFGHARSCRSSSRAGLHHQFCVNDNVGFRVCIRDF